MADVQPLEAGWQEHLGCEFDKDYMARLRAFLGAEKQAGKTLYPAGQDIFNAFNLTPFEQVKVVILGQDPYHGPNQAHGLCFSVQRGVKTPPSLVNIYKEIQRDLGIAPASHGNLSHWAEQGVLLLNAVLTVEAGQAASHQKQGWETFTDQAIEHLNRDRDGLVFLLWGSHAQKKGRLIDRERHCVLTAPHPSPLSAHRGFLGCGHFSRANQYLLQQGKTAIDWSVPE
ncbi:uracil-DNA glycosylase [Alcanivorax nanhaiticus]|uniref:Uracil-DNA glycosylase n=1 Tax=Alcanivorax nanhaiticus TaxID=1177154 RepID=A0A095UVE6_9GAMM|nr:uracil-DNA glycosylase [Alcanivorax nanhaiticus]KGD66525.1 uracil-DNA glycosylase [Alcanivorax nanhaiticus]